MIWYRVAGMLFQHLFYDLIGPHLQRTPVDWSFELFLWINPRFEPGMRIARAWTEAWTVNPLLKS